MILSNGDVHYCWNLSKGLANPPFMTPKGGITPHNKFVVKANRAEVLFVDYICEHLKSNGRAGIVVPDSILYSEQTDAFINLRKF